MSRHTSRRAIAEALESVPVMPRPDFRIYSAMTEGDYVLRAITKEAIEFLSLVRGEETYSIPPVSIGMPDYAVPLALKQIREAGFTIYREAE